MNKTAFYIRCSTQEQEPELQIRDLSTLCDKPNEIFKENISAWCENVQRPVFDSVISLIKKKKISDLYVWDLDRIHRNRKKLQEFFLLCKNYGCKVHSYRQKWLQEINSIPPPFDEIVSDLLISIFGWIGEEESQKKSERIKLAVKKKGKQTISYKGNKWGRKAFPVQTINRVMELHEQRKTIRQIASLVKVYDKNNNERNISKSAVHKIVVENCQQKNS